MGLLKYWKSLMPSAAATCELSNGAVILPMGSGRVMASTKLSFQYCSVPVVVSGIEDVEAW